MPAPLICHLLIGPPGSGKSTLAAQLAKQGNYQIVSTDQIRQELYGDESIQGDWSIIEAKVLSQIKSATRAGQPVIYDATNAKRSWRTALLMQLNSSLTPLSFDGRVEGVSAAAPCAGESANIHWMAWHLTTPLATCKAWNQKRQRQVPEGVIESMFQSLQDFPPLPAEGFATVSTIASTPDGFDLKAIEEKIQRLCRTLTNRTNRTKHRKVTLHSYSRLLDFDRLLHLIALAIQYPGIGCLHLSDPVLVESIVGNVPIATPLEEICALMRQIKGAIYADANAIATDLQWLEDNGVMGRGGDEKAEDRGQKAEFTLHPPLQKNNDPIVTHAYSDAEPFQRLLETIRLIVHHPFLHSGSGSLQTLVDVLKQGVIPSCFSNSNMSLRAERSGGTQSGPSKLPDGKQLGIISGDCLDTVRKDIEKILKPYKILPDFPLRHGYFVGTGILSRHELRKVFGVLQSQAKSLDDPVALAVYEMFQERIIFSKIDTPDVYPVRAIGNRNIIDADSLPSSVLSKNIEKLEDAIANGELLELNRTRGGGRFLGDEDKFFKAWPLQIVFHNVAWYLGLECEGEKDGNLFRFERLDRLFMGQLQGSKRDRRAQERSLKQLQSLYTASAGLFLGYSVSDQQQFLSTNKAERSGVEVTVELWFNDFTFRFICEGTKRFPTQKMSPPLEGGLSSTRSNIFSLPKTEDANFPNRFRVRFPKWSLHDVDLWRWIVGFGGKVKVVQPPQLVAKVKEFGEEICRIYQD